MLKESPQFPTESPPSRMKGLLPSLKKSGVCTTKSGQSRRNTSTLPSLNSKGRYAEEATTPRSEQRSLFLRELQRRTAFPRDTNSNADFQHRGRSNTARRKGWTGALQHSKEEGLDGGLSNTASREGLDGGCFYPTLLFS